jgi:hypothetical protein
MPLSPPLIISTVFFLFLKLISSQLSVSSLKDSIASLLHKLLSLEMEVSTPTRF